MKKQALLLSLTFAAGIAFGQLSAPAAAPKRATGIGGVFFKAKDPAALRNWYARHLGFNTDEYGTKFVTRDFTSKHPAVTQWSLMAADEQSFSGPLMINYRVQDLASLVTRLKAEGVQVVDAVESTPYGKFVHVLDGEGNKVELWEPPSTAGKQFSGKGWSW